jgi:hypothetical protein
MISVEKYFRSVINFKNFCKCQNVPPFNTTIKTKLVITVKFVFIGPEKICSMNIKRERK